MTDKKRTMKDVVLAFCLQVADKLGKDRLEAELDVRSYVFPAMKGLEKEISEEQYLSALEDMKSDSNAAVKWAMEGITIPDEDTNSAFKDFLDRPSRN